MFLTIIPSFDARSCRVFGLIKKQLLGWNFFRELMKRIDIYLFISNIIFQLKTFLRYSVPCFMFYKILPNIDQSEASNEL
jgi:hypothetical protein